MAQLIQMRHRIKAIETIKKVTHAMRLISMSSHTRLQGKRSPLEHYYKEVAELLHHVNQVYYDKNQQQNEAETAQTTQDPLVILIGAQKGLCGSFNSILFSQFELFIERELKDTCNIIIAGKQAAESLKTKPNRSIIGTYNQLTSEALSKIANSITKSILSPKSIHQRPVWVVSNILKSFFSQKPIITQLLPLPKQSSDEPKENIEPFIFEQSLESIINYLEYEYVYSTLYHLLFESLTAEQAARFVSMDNATRNAKNLLDATRQEYNKLRQAKITKELTELTSSMQ